MTDLCLPFDLYRDIAVIRCLNRLGTANLLQHNFKASLYYFAQALERIKNFNSQKNGFYKESRAWFNTISNDAPLRASNQRALEPLALDVSTHDIHWHCIAATTVLHNIALVYATVGDFSTSKKMLNFAVALIKEEMEERDLNELLHEESRAVLIVSVYMSLAVVMDQLSTQLPSYLTQVLRVFNIVIGLGRRYLRQHPIMSNAYQRMAHVLLQSGHTQEALMAFDMAYEIRYWSIDEYFTHNHAPAA